MNNNTILYIKNDSAKDVEVFLTLGRVEGCIQNIENIPFIEKVINPLQGSFVLKSKCKARYNSLDLGFNGTLAFGTPPMNCPTDTFKSGINIAEFILNNGFQGENAQETVDISCVAGVNAQIKIEFKEGSKWNAGSNYPHIIAIQNKTIGQNVGLVGVYPYGCDECTKSVNPPFCQTLPLGAPNPIVTQSEPICNVQRNASSSGGSVTIIFQSFYQNS